MLHLHTDRLHMQPLTRNDWQLFLTLHNEPEALRYVCDPLSRAQIEERFASRLPHWHTGAEHWLCLVIRARHSGEELGFTGLRMIAPHAAQAEVGYLLRSRHQGKGVATESLKALIEHAREGLGLKSLQATVTDGNHGSQHVLEKCGFVLERRVEQAFRLNGEDFDDLIFHRDLTV